QKSGATRKESRSRSLVFGVVQQQTVARARLQLFLMRLFSPALAYQNVERLVRREARIPAGTRLVIRTGYKAGVRGDVLRLRRSRALARCCGALPYNPSKELVSRSKLNRSATRLCPASAKRSRSP